MGRLAGLVVVAAFITFCVVQDREMSAAAGSYVTAQRKALAGQGPRVTIDEIMIPAKRASLREALPWSGRVAMAGLIAMLVSSRVRARAQARSRRG